VAGTNASQKAVTGGPAIVLVNPQLGENIGTAARAMYNCGLTDLRLVAPRDGWPSEKAQRAASGADPVLEAARVYSDLREAVAGLRHVYATTARDRYLVKRIVTPREAAAEMRAKMAAGEGCGILFGAERMGLVTDDVSLADSIISVPLNPAFSSLNLAQAVLLIGYEWFQANPAEVPPLPEWTENEPATGQSLRSLYEHLESELDRAGFLYPPEKRPGMVISIRNIFARVGLTEQEVRTLRGIIKALVEPRARGESAERPLGRKPREH
jgi:tRNA/rRNA methyltransferase